MNILLDIQEDTITVMIPVTSDHIVIRDEELKVGDQRIDPGLTDQESMRQRRPREDLNWSEGYDSLHTGCLVGWEGEQDLTD